MSAPPQIPGPRASTPKISGIPTPGATRTYSGIPTPGRRSAPSIPVPSYSAGRGSSNDEDAMRALSDAIRANNPAQHRATPDLQLPNDASSTSGARRSIASSTTSATSKSLFSSRASTSSSISAVSSNMDRSTATLRPKTPSSAASSTSNYRSFQTPRSNVSSRPVSRQSDVFRAPSRQAAYPKAPDLGDMVSIDTAQLKAEGVLRFLGTTEFKAGIWAGVELFPDYVEKGKNDGEVQGVRYFTCAPKTGVFVLATAIKVINDRPDSVASGRFTPVSGRQTPPLKLQQPNRPGSLFKTPEALRVTPGSRASKYVGMTAKDLAARKAEARTGSTSPTRKIQHSPTRSVTSAFPTPKASSTRPTASGLQGPTPRRSHPATSLVTPRAAPARGATAMSPPPVPGSASSFMNRSPSRRTAGSPDTTTSTESHSLEANGRSLQDRIARLMSSSSTMHDSDIATSPSRTSVSDLLPAADLRRRGSSPERMSLLQQRIAELELELEQSKIDNADAPGAAALSAAIDPALEEENNRLIARVTALEKELSTRVDAAKDEAELLSSRLRESADSLEALRADLDNNSKQSSQKIAELEVAIDQAQKAKEESVEAHGQVSSAKALVEQEVAALKEQLASTINALETDKTELAHEVTELRLAGQETIALYEEKLNNAEGLRYDLEEAVKTLQDQLRKQAEPISKEEMTARATTAAQIDNETLQEQVDHLQSRIGTLEDQLHDARATSDAHEQAYTARMARFRESETQLKQDIENLTAEKVAISNAEAAALARVQEVTTALQESDGALEDARAEIEVLRSDLALLEAGKASEDIDPPSPGPAAELQAQLESERQAKQEATLAKTQLEEEIKALKSESEELAQQFQLAQSTSQDQLNQLSEMSRLLDQRTRELEAARGGNLSLSTSSRDGARSVSGSREPNLREQVTGLKHVVQELTKENGALTALNKKLEKECEALRESLARLEDEFDKKLLQDTTNMQASEEGSPLLQDVTTLRQALDDNRKRHELEMDQMRKKLFEADKKLKNVELEMEREVHDLTQVLEGKIYDEDKLEQEIRRLKSDLRKATKSSGSRKERGSTNSANSDTPSNADACEACGRPGHDIATCSEVFNTSNPPANGRLSIGSSHDESFGLWCEDCESSGHTAENCPYAQDVF